MKPGFADLAKLGAELQNLPNFFGALVDGWLCPGL